MEALLLILLFLYNVYLVYYLLYEKNIEQTQSEDKTYPGATFIENENDIVGKSRFRMDPKMPQATIQEPQVSIISEDENDTIIDVTFADETNNSALPQLPLTMLDEAFSHHIIKDITLEFADDESDYDDIQTPYASGISFEEISEAIKVIDSSSISENDSLKAGEVFTELDGNDFFVQLMKSSSQRAQRISELMDHFLSNSISKNEKIIEIEVQNNNTTESTPDDEKFDIRNYV